jgi:hypothetical protein
VLGSPCRQLCVGDMSGAEGGAFRGRAGRGGEGGVTTAELGPPGGSLPQRLSPCSHPSHSSEERRVTPPPPSHPPPHPTPTPLHPHTSHASAINLCIPLPSQPCLCLSRQAPPFFSPLVLYPACAGDITPVDYQAATVDPIQARRLKKASHHLPSSASKHSGQKSLAPPPASNPVPQHHPLPPSSCPSPMPAVAALDRPALPARRPLLSP